ncbi:hypothetical protein GOC14_29425 [Sinorhizobium meliloti]|nr:hypothetical protein [Sinorhizobium meliloti]
MCADGLSAEVVNTLNADPYSGHLFLFRGKRGGYLKALYWDGTGMCLFATISVHTTPLSSPVDVLGSVCVCWRAAARSWSWFQRLHCFCGKSPSGITHRGGCGQRPKQRVAVV